MQYIKQKRVYYYVHVCICTYIYAVYTESLCTRGTIQVHITLHTVIQHIDARKYIHVCGLAWHFVQ